MSDQSTSGGISKKLSEVKISKPDNAENKPETHDELDFKISKTLIETEQDENNSVIIRTTTSEQTDLHSYQKIKKKLPNDPASDNEGTKNTKETPNSIDSNPKLKSVSFFEISDAQTKIANSCKSESLMYNVVKKGNSQCKITENIKKCDKEKYIPDKVIKSNNVESTESFGFQVPSESYQGLEDESSTVLIGSKSLVADETECNYIKQESSESAQVESDQIDKNNDNQKTVEPTVSTLEREILLRGEISDSKKAKVLQLPKEHIAPCPVHCEREIMGDDVTKKTAHILCECDIPGVSGAAVPVVTSFTSERSSNSSNLTNYNKDSSSKRAKVKKYPKDNENYYKSKPSFIPKLSSYLWQKRSTSINRTDKNNSSGKTYKQKSARNISFKATSSFKKLGKQSSETADMNKKIMKNDFYYDRKYNLDSKLSSEFSMQVSRLAEDVSNIIEINDSIDRLTAVDNLYKQVLYLKKIATDLKSTQKKPVSETLISDHQRRVGTNNQEALEENVRSRSKENNRIHIKFLSNKAMLRKRNNCCSKTQTDFDENKSDPLKIEKLSDNRPNEIDSMDGMFIPVNDEPPKMMEDDDEDGMDITIRFPELQKSSNQQNGSHLSVCFSNISAEALGRLKRCPKEFTLHMDFVQGRMYFQSGKSANNFSIGPDLKITECTTTTIDSRRSDIISIKPSTECLFASQIIPVEGSTRQDSIRILKSTDSEIFNVVSMPFVNRRKSITTKSCITFKNLRKTASESFITDRQCYKSMPQIPSLTKIMEEPAVESVAGGTRTAVITSEKKHRNRNLLKKRTISSCECNNC